MYYKVSHRRGLERAEARAEEAEARVAEARVAQEQRVSELFHVRLFVHFVSWKGKPPTIDWIKREYFL